MADTVVYAVHVNNYEPPEVVALYSNQVAARAHASNGSDLSVSPLTVASDYVNTELDYFCANCGHMLVRLGNQWTCTERCWCTMAGCPPC